MSMQGLEQISQQSIKSISPIWQRMLNSTIPRSLLRLIGAQSYATFGLACLVDQSMAEPCRVQHFDRHPFDCGRPTEVMVLVQLFSVMPGFEMFLSLKSVQNACVLNLTGKQQV